MGSLAILLIESLAVFIASVQGRNRNNAAYWGQSISMQQPNITTSSAPRRGPREGFQETPADDTMRLGQPPQLSKAQVLDLAKMKRAAQAQSNPTSELERVAKNKARREHQEKVNKEKEELKKIETEARKRRKDEETRQREENKRQRKLGRSGTGSSGTAASNPASTGYNPASTGYNPASTGYNPASTGYNPASTGYNPPSNPTYLPSYPIDSGYHPVPNPLYSQPSFFRYPFNPSFSSSPSFPSQFGSNTPRPQGEEIPFRRVGHGNTMVFDVDKFNASKSRS